MKEELSYFQIRDFEELNKRKIIIFGASNAGDKMLDILLRNNVKEENILFFCDNNPELWKEIEKVIRGGMKIKKKVISPNELKKYCENHKEVVIIIATLVMNFCTEIIEQIQEFAIQNTVILRDEIVYLENTLFYIKNSEKKLEEIEVYKKYFLEQEAMKRKEFFYKAISQSINTRNPFISLFLPPKVGSCTLEVSLSSEYPRTKMHSVFWMKEEDKRLYEKYVKKIIIGVRDVITQNLSLVYQMKSGETIFDVRNQWVNPQKVFNYYVVDSILNPIQRKQRKKYGFEETLGCNLLIQSWFEDELKLGFDIDIFEYPFNKSLGYQVIKTDKYEILLYRLESMDSLEEVFREFLDIKDFKFSKANEAKYKWYNKSYRNFLKNVTMPKEYIDVSYDSKYMKHFYTEEEILKFREKWEKHIDPNWSIQGE